jgi:hypothetical protein
MQKPLNSQILTNVHFLGVLELPYTCIMSNGYDFELQISVTRGCVVQCP